MAKVLYNLSRSCLINTPVGVYNFQWTVCSQQLVKCDFRKCVFYQYSSDKCPENKPKLTLVQRFKQMYRDYWYILVPVHLVTSAGWFGGFYYLAKSGVDIVPLLESMYVSEKFTTPLKDSSMGYLAISYALYKIATPLRYTVTLGGTTITINYLKEWGYIKPVPSATQIKEMYKERKENILETFHEYKDKKVKEVEKNTQSVKSSIKGIKSNKFLEYPKKTEGL